MRKLIVTFFYLGYVPKAPGTAASAAMALAAGLYFAHWANHWPLLAAAALFMVLGVALGRWAMNHLQSPDPKQFVLDEAAGQALACVAAAPLFHPPWGPWPAVAMAFALFRFFDILKPPPVRQAESLPAGWGIMMDDIVAGLISAGLLLAFNYYYPVA